MTSIQEDVHYDGGPARGDLIFNILLGFTLIGLPFTIGAVVRALWLRFRITSRRISVTGGWMGKDKTQVVYSQISEVRTCLLYTSPSPRDKRQSRMPSSA